MEVRREERTDPGNDPAASASSELDERRWSVVSFRKVEAEQLTYTQAVELMSELDLRGVNGLCIVTDEAATRINR